MKRYLPLFIGIMLVSINAFSQIVILKSNPANAYAALVSSTTPTTGTPNPIDICAAAWTGGGSPGGWRTFFKLNDSALAGITIDSAILQLYADPTSGLGYTGTPTFGTNNASVLYRVTSSWLTSMTWLTMPPYSSVDSVILPQSTSTVENYLHINVTNVLNDIVISGSNYGFMIKSKQETTPYNSMIFYSSSATDSSKRPQILIYGHAADHLFFTGGHVQSLTLCVNEATAAVPVNTFLAAIDSVSGLPETWSLITPPAHGVALTAYTSTSTGGVITPVGLTYTPTSGYIGSDMFKVRVTNGMASDTTTINVTINPYPDAGIISGPDSVCPGQTVNLSETVAGGIWSTSSFTISDISSSGIAMGLVPGLDTIIYTISNSCGVTSALFPFTVRSYIACHTVVNTISNPANNLKIYPNPANDELNISSSGIIEFISITNLVGQTVYTHGYNSEMVRVNVSDLPSGVYFVKVNGTEVKKFLKE